MIKDLIVTLTDVETGEILAYTSKKNLKRGTTSFESCRVPLDLSIKSDCDRVSSWFDSFMRGCRSGRNLSITLTLREHLEPPTPLSLNFF